MNGTFQFTIRILVICLAAACNNSTSIHKSKDSRLKSVTVSIPTRRFNPSKTILQNLSADTSYSIFNECLQLTGLAEVLSKPGPFTVFAPNNSAFGKLPQGSLEGLIQDRKGDLANILSHHIVAGAVEEKDIKLNRRLTTLSGEPLIVTKRNNETIINGVNMDTGEIWSRNGRIYIVEGLLFPKDQNPGAY